MQESPRDRGKKVAILFAATILAARKLIDLDPNKPNMAKGFFVDRAIEDAKGDVASVRGVVDEIHQHIKGENGPAVVIAPLKEVRKLRQSPAHKFVDDEFSIKYRTRSRSLLRKCIGQFQIFGCFSKLIRKHRDTNFPTISNWNI
ncbi:MAG: hypothetical protein DMG56_09055 [Acidobacteria bacterium]|nr:MAG: hypothetical protein DMG53_07560 [Acidobacteriota bacterium]PYU63672.1 MAG: hypothetical protein DMG56_09055 [Acidobacteriota bacterium]